MPDYSPKDPDLHYLKNSTTSSHQYIEDRGQRSKISKKEIVTCCEETTNTVKSSARIHLKILLAEGIEEDSSVEQNPVEEHHQKKNMRSKGSRRHSSSIFLLSFLMICIHSRTLLVRGFQNNFAFVTSASKRIHDKNIRYSGHRGRETFRRLFFRKTDVAPQQPPRQKVSPPSQVFEALQSSQFSVPYSFSLGDDLGTTLTLRCMTRDDFDEIVPMCISEFGLGPTTSFADFPIDNLSARSISQWWERLYFEPMITMALTAKIAANEGRNTVTNFRDPAVLVLTRHDKTNSNPVVVGMVELSLQVPEATKNPPPLPTPLWVKKLYSRIVNRSVQGWVTNLLIGDDYRGLGYSKILMAATEGIAKKWKVNSIFLHADADSKSGRVPQGLYEGLGYQIIKAESAQFAWMGDSFDNRIHIVEGVPLLFLYKIVNENRR
jgi:ribosomal protein S18 acetylase RimI-like enzyme